MRNVRIARIVATAALLACLALAAPAQAQNSNEIISVVPGSADAGTTGLLVKDTLAEIDLIGFVPGKMVDKQVIKSKACL